MPSRRGVYILEDDFYGREALQMYAAKSGKLNVIDACALDHVASIIDAESSHTPAAAQAAVVLSSDDPGTIADIAKQLKSLTPRPRIFVMLSKPTEENIHAALSSHAAGIMQKDEVGIAIGEAIASHEEGELFVTPLVVPHLFSMFSKTQKSRPRIIQFTDPLARATSRVKQTMKMYCQWGMSKKSIARELDMSENTIASRVKTGYMLLNVSSRTEATETILRSIFRT